jgi:hypothetical protein
MNEETANRHDVESTGKNMTNHYRRVLRPQQSGGGFESAGDESGAPDLSEGGIKDRIDYTQAELYRIIDEHLGGGADLKEIADQIVKGADKSLRILRDDDEELLRREPDALDGLEAIVRTDGSRPSFMIRNGEADRSTSPIGSWSDILDVSAELLRDAISCVGRIDVPSVRGGFTGTGFLIQENLIITNRHVLQMSADRQPDGTWKFKPGAAIDFGHEFRGLDSINRRALKKLVFCGSRPINLQGMIDHTKLDLALIELSPAEPAARPGMILGLDLAPDWAGPLQTIFTIGYPGPPRLGSGYAPTLLEKLFQATYGCKRLAPGEIITSQQSVADWTATHDATTLGGNSGSVMLVIGREQIAAGLHYGGSQSPGENWGHILGQTLDQTDGVSSQTLREILVSRDVELIDRISSNNQ